jgi:hypothetical protein
MMRIPILTEICLQGDKKLVQKLWSTWPSEYNELWGSWNHAIEMCEQRIALENRTSKNQRLTEWRTRMRQCAVFLAICIRIIIR